MNKVPVDPFFRVPLSATRAGRVQMLGDAADALLAGDLPHLEARLFLASALRAWLDRGGRTGSLEREFLRITGRPGSHLTAARLLQQLAPQEETIDSLSQVV